MAHLVGGWLRSCGPKPLSEGEGPAGLTGLVLDEVWHQVGPHADVGAPVAAHLVVVGR